MPDEDPVSDASDPADQARVVPVLPCGSLDTVLPFYTALGFETLYAQHRPYIYGSVRRGGIQLDFTGSAKFDAQSAPGSYCLVVVPEVDRLHAAFRAGLKAAFGRVPRAGLPRLGPVSQQKTDRRFNMADPAGNHLIVIAPIAAARDAAPTPLGRAIKAATLSAYSEQELGWAATHLDAALSGAAEEQPDLRLRATVMRADIAAMMHDTAALARHIAGARALISQGAVGDAALLTQLSDLESVLAEAR